jgi:hypothetical protein
LKHSRWLVLAFLLSPIAHAQQSVATQPAHPGPVGKARPAGMGANMFLSKPQGVAHEVAVTARDFATFRDPQWSVLTLGQIGAGTVDMVTSLNNLHSCPSCKEIGVSRFFVGAHPDAHKYIVGGILEIGIEAVTVHYFRNHGPIRKWYWRTLWTLPQSFSLYEHARAANHNAALDQECNFSGMRCK